MQNFKSKIISLVFNTNIGFKLMKDRLENTIIMYHGVSSSNSPYNKRHTLKKDFVNHLLFLKKHCNIITLDSFFKKEFKKNTVNVAITFDDGYWNNYSIAKPILEELEVPATFFITGINETDEKFLWADFVDIVAHSRLKNKLHIDTIDFSLKENVFFNDQISKSMHEYIKGDHADYDTKIKLYQNLTSDEISMLFTKKNEEFWRLMSNNEIIETSKSKYISIQSHGFYHNNLGTIKLEDALNEIKQSKKYLDNLTQKEINTIGFPDGSYTREVINACKNIGLKQYLAAEGYLYNEDVADERILDRKGMYDIGQANNQIFNALKTI